jgi:hypothetical protein
MGLLAVPRRNPNAAQKVHSVRHGFEVRRIDTVTHPAEMIEFFSGWHSAAAPPKRKNMRRARRF